jgi:predicted N-acyltransferase
VILAIHEDEPISSAICFRSDDSLYGRYWGSAGRFHSLHFETCYYPGIEYCIKNGLQTFEPGTQGEHKIARGFVPVNTWSAHYIADPRFSNAIADYLEREGEHIDGYVDELNLHVPYKSGETP